MPRRKNSPKRTLENVHKEYDENGNWVQEKNRLKGAIRQAFRMSPQMWEVKERARIELPPALKKDGTPGKKPRVRYKCSICEELFTSKYVQTDHIVPVVPLHKKEADMTYDEIARGIFCKKENLQVVCSTPMSKNNGKPSCHKIKTDEENYIRNRITKENWRGGDWDLEDRIEELKEEFKDYLKEKEEKRLAKEKRKNEREAKRKKQQEV